MATSVINRLHLHDMGTVTTMPVNFADGVVAFVLTSNCTIINGTLAAGNRIFGYYANNIFHGVAIGNDTKLKTIRYNGNNNEWVLLATFSGSQ